MDLRLCVTAKALYRPGSYESQVHYTQMNGEVKRSYSLIYNVTETRSFPHLIMLPKWYSSLK